MNFVRSTPYEELRRLVLSNPVEQLAPIALALALIPREHAVHFLVYVGVLKEGETLEEGHARLDAETTGEASIPKKKKKEKNNKKKKQKENKKKKSS